MDHNIINIIEKVDTTGYTLIIPSVSVGNVAQLTVDLLISSHGFQKYATIWDPAIIPTAGSDPFEKDSKDVCVACELYVNKLLKVVVMQLRSSIEFKLALDFFGKLKRLITDLRFSDVILLASSSAHELHDIRSSPFRYISNQDYEYLFEKLEVPPMEASLNGKCIIFGGGFAAKLYEVLSDSINCTVIIRYVSEGDNRNDAHLLKLMLERVVRNFVDAEPRKESCPYSWRFLYGNPAPTHIY